MCKKKMIISPKSIKKQSKEKKPVYIKTRG